jgi:hypothetical protein
MDNLKGMGWMTLAMLAFALADMSIKLPGRGAAGGTGHASCSASPAR